MGFLQPLHLKEPMVFKHGQSFLDWFAYVCSKCKCVKLELARPGCEWVCGTCSYRVTVKNSFAKRDPFKPDLEVAAPLSKRTKPKSLFGASFKNNRF